MGCCESKGENHNADMSRDSTKGQGATFHDEGQVISENVLQDINGRILVISRANR